MNIGQMKMELMQAEARLLKGRENVEKYTKYVFGLEYHIEFLKQQIARESQVKPDVKPNKKKLKDIAKENLEKAAGKNPLIG